MNRLDNLHTLNFEKYPAFHLVKEGWGSANPIDVVKLLDSVVENFYPELVPQKITNKSVIVFNSSFLNPPTDSPEIRKNEKTAIIFLSSKDLYWSQYAYQFSHELCHHIIDSDFLTRIDEFGWLEESICELASLFILQKMSTTWLTCAPYPAWSNYAASLKEYSDNIINSTIDLKIPLDHWFLENINSLKADRYKRDMNKIIAINMLPLFVNDPELWKTIQYLKDIPTINEMKLSEFLSEWKVLLTNDLKENFKKFEQLMIGE